MTPRVPVSARRSRRARLLALQQRLSRERLARRIGTTMTAMIDGPAPEARHAGAGRAYAARGAGSAWEVDGGVRVGDDRDGVPDLSPGDRVQVRVTGATAYDLLARVEPALSILRGNV